jgi:hypothetical protein
MDWKEMVAIISRCRYWNKTLIIWQPQSSTRVWSPHIPSSEVVWLHVYWIKDVQVRAVGCYMLWPFWSSVWPRLGTERWVSAVTQFGPDSQLCYVYMWSHLRSSDCSKSKKSL